MTTSFKYGAFQIEDGIAQWSGDETVRVPMQPSPSEYCFMEGVWRPGGRPMPESPQTAITGLCLWAMHDCVFEFEPKGKGNPGARRSFASHHGRQDVFKRIGRGDKVKFIHIAENPFGPYQIRLMRWQADTVKRLGIKKVFYSLPVDEYLQSAEELAGLDGWHGRAARLEDMIRRQHDALRWAIRAMLECEIDFIHPMRRGVSSVEESWVWPYLNLDVDLGIEEMEEVRIAYEARERGVEGPPVLLGALAEDTPYNWPLEEGEWIYL
jgi:hypothetical protein